MVIVAVEAVPAESKPSAAVRVRISTDERHGFGAAAPLSARASFLVQDRAGNPVELSPKLVRHIGLVSTCTKQLSPIYFARSAAAALSVRLRVFLSAVMSASMRDVAAEHPARGLLSADLLFS